MSTAQVQAQIKAPLLAAISLSHQLLPKMLNSTQDAHFDLPYMATYTASRSGLLSFTRALDEEFKGQGVPVRSVCPAWVDTDYLLNNQNDSDWYPKISRYFATITAKQAASYGIKAIECNQRELNPVLLLKSETTLASDQIIRYPEHKNASNCTFSVWAFDEQNIMPIMRTYFKFYQDYYLDHEFRCDMLNVCYPINVDQNPIFSYSYNGAVMTLDPVTPGEPGRDDFLQAYNESVQK